MFSLCAVARLDTAMGVSNGIKRESGGVLTVDNRSENARFVLIKRESGGIFPQNSGESEARPPRLSLVRMNLAEDSVFKTPTSFRL